MRRLMLCSSGKKTVDSSVGHVAQNTLIIRMDCDMCDGDVSFCEEDGGFFCGSCGTEYVDHQNGM